MRMEMSMYMIEFSSHLTCPWGQKKNLIDIIFINFDFSKSKQENARPREPRRKNDSPTSKSLILGLKWQAQHQIKLYTSFSLSRINQYIKSKLYTFSIKFIYKLISFLVHN